MHDVTSVTHTFSFLCELPEKLSKLKEAGILFIAYLLHGLRHSFQGDFAIEL